MDFYVMSGCGNRFAVFDGRDCPLRLQSADIQRIASADCGAGVDQVISIEQSIKADLYVRIWNRDGSTTQACGNAMRCVAWLFMRETHAERAALETDGGLVYATRCGDMTVAVDMGSPLLRWEEIPLAHAADTRNVDLTIQPVTGDPLTCPGAVNMGNPHVVFFVSDLANVDIETLGPMIEAHKMFPRRVNVGFAQLQSSNRLRLRVWERGTGLTSACGSGACASVVAACRRDLIGRQATVVTDGGDLLINWRDTDDHVIMTGPVTLGAHGVIGASQAHA